MYKEIKIYLIPHIKKLEVRQNLQLDTECFITKGWKQRKTREAQMMKVKPVLKEQVPIIQHGDVTAVQ